MKAQSADTAALYGLHDRGVIAPGMKADMNVIDFDALQLGEPEMVYDLPAGDDARSFRKLTAIDTRLLMVW